MAASRNQAKSNGQSQEKTRQMELAISLLLRIGVLLSAILISLGAILFIITGKSGYASDLTPASQGTSNVSIYTHYQSEQTANRYFPTTPGEILAGALAFKSFGLIALGLFLLILTPILRVAISVIAFALEKDWAFVIFTLVVLAVLLFSFFLGKAGG